ncbi:MAG: hypothetical protein HND48_25570 [Chloroflexi bacterium]|nr:hypothetical protein [Chloroflexota bacterium]
MKRRIFVVVALLSLIAAFSVSAQESPMTLRLASWQWEDPAYLPFWEGTTNAFMEANPNVTIERFAFPIDQLWNQINLQVAAGTPPEIARSHRLQRVRVYEPRRVGPAERLLRRHRHRREG